MGVGVVGGKATKDQIWLGDRGECPTERTVGTPLGLRRWLGTWQGWLCREHRKPGGKLTCFA